jgi:hypothetical protein
MPKMDGDAVNQEGKALASDNTVGRFLHLFKF